MVPTDWWRGAVIYQIYPRSFCDSNGDGIGDLPGITAKLRYVASLGVDAIWLCPFFASPQKDFGYDVTDHTAVDPIFGTLEDFDALLDRAHALGLKVLIDQVWSHTSDRHPWFLQSRSAAVDAKSDWYVWADPSSDGTPPNNWLSVFGGSAWTWEPRRRQYYLHHFLSHQPALNLHNPAVIEALLEIGDFWLQRGVDGFRLDAIDFLLHDRALRDNPAAPRSGDMPIKLFGLQQHVHDMLQPDAHGLLTRIRGLMDRYPRSVTLGEVSSQPGSMNRICDYTAADDRLHMAYSLRPLRGAFNWDSLQALLDEHAAVSHTGWTCWSFSNHDVERAISRWNPRRGHDDPPQDFAALLMALLLSLRGSVCLYQGEELGLPEADLEIEQLRDPFGIAFWPEFRGRDGSRTPMPWESDSPSAGFTAAAEPWLPIPRPHRDRAVGRLEHEPQALLHHYRRFLAWRRTQPTLLYGSLEPLDLGEPLIGFTRTHGADRILAIFNVGDCPVPVSLDRFGPLNALPSSGFAPDIHQGQAILPPYGVLFAALDYTHASRNLEFAAG